MSGCRPRARAILTPRGLRVCAQVLCSRQLGKSMVLARASPGGLIQVSGRASAASWGGQGGRSLCGIDEVNFPPAAAPGRPPELGGRGWVCWCEGRVRGEGVGIYAQFSRSEAVSCMLPRSSDRCGGESLAREEDDMSGIRAGCGSLEHVVSDHMALLRLRCARCAIPGVVHRSVISVLCSHGCDLGPLLIQPSVQRIPRYMNLGDTLSLL